MPLVANPSAHELSERRSFQLLQEMIEYLLDDQWPESTRVFGSPKEFH
jgi:hypothetical protein